MDSDSDSSDNVIYGTPLEPLDEDAPRPRKPVPVEAQTVRDAEGRQRFHGAFTGGFSAGFFNTVSTPAGFTPSSFVSSRSKRADAGQMAPKDFMDEEDLGEFGFASQRVGAKAEFLGSSTAGAGKKYPKFSEGPIPGEPVLAELIKPTRETVGAKILKSMGWRPGQGIGPRITAAEKKQQQRVYGCARPPAGSSGGDSGSSDEEEEARDAAWSRSLLVPDDRDAPLVRPKLDRFGLGYSGLQRHSVLSSASQRLPSTLRHRDAAGKLAIRGQAFGVGAFEEDDDDIYAADDMTQYDFEQRPVETQRKPPAPSVAAGVQSLMPPVSGFASSSVVRQPVRRRYPPPQLPAGFKPRRQLRVRTSRFEPLAEERRGLERHRLSAAQRGAMIGEQVAASMGDQVAPSISTAEKTSVDGSDARETGVPTRGVMILPAPVNAAEDHVKMPQEDDDTSSRMKPFAADEQKQRRYELFLRLKDENKKELFGRIQPPSLTDWEREREYCEFQRASAMFGRLCSSLAARFVSAGTVDSSGTDLPSSGDRLQLDTATQAARSGMFGRLTRSQQDWMPDPMLCRRFNVKQPRVGGDERPRAESRRPSLFDPPPITTGSGTSQMSPPAPRWLDAGGETVAAIEAAPDATAGPDEQVSYGAEESVEPARPAGPLAKPPPDLFKAIFDDTESEEDEEAQQTPAEDVAVKDQEAVPKPPSIPNGSADTGSSSLENESSRVELGSSALESGGGSAAGEAVCGSASGKDATTAPAAGQQRAFSLFDNIDLDALNSWRRRQPGESPTTALPIQVKPSSAPADPRPGAAPAAIPRPGAANLFPGAANLSPEEYGPALPPSRPVFTGVVSSHNGSHSRAIGVHAVCSQSSAGYREKPRKRPHPGDDVVSSDGDRTGSGSRHKRKKKHTKKKERSKKKKRKKSKRSSSSGSSSSDDEILKKLHKAVKHSKKRKG